MKAFWEKIGTWFKEVFFAFIHAVSLGAVQFWKETADERKTFFGGIVGRMKEYIASRKKK